MDVNVVQLLDAMLLEYEGAILTSYLENSHCPLHAVGGSV